MEGGAVVKPARSGGDEGETSHQPVDHFRGDGRRRGRGSGALWGQQGEEKKKKKYGVYERKRGLGDKKPSLLHVGARGRVCGVDGVVAERWSNGWRPQGGA